MRDFIFTDPSESTKQVIFRTDGLTVNSNRITIMKIIGNKYSDIYTNDQWKRTALLAFREGSVTSKADLIAFATLWQLDLVTQDDKGTNSSILVDWNSDSSADSW